MSGKGAVGRLVYFVFCVLLLAALACWALSTGGKSEVEPESPPIAVPAPVMEEAPPVEVPTEAEPLPEEAAPPEPAQEQIAEIVGFGQLVQQLLAEVAAQEETDRMILEELENGGFSFEDPLVIVDPYQCSPLTALLVFQTEEPARVSVRVAGKTKDTDVSFAFSAWNTKHLIPVYGLYEDMENSVSLSLQLQDGSAAETLLRVATEKLPPARDVLIIQTYAPKPQKTQEGLNFTYVNKLAFDRDGDIRWSIPGWGNLQATEYLYRDGTYITAYGNALQGDTLFFERNLLGKFLRIYYSPYGVHHDITEAPQGNLLVTGSNDAGTVEDFIYEIERETGAIVHSLDLKTVLPRTSKRSEESTVDWLHNNAIVWADGDIILSNRHNSSVVRLAWPSGEIRWILASPYGWSPIYQRNLLQPAGDGEFEWQSYQHAPEILPDMDGDPDTMDLLLYDNGTHRFAEDRELQRKIRANEAITPENYSRMVHYRINEKEKTIEQIWQYGKERGEEWYAIRCGSANLLHNGNRLGFSFMDEDVGGAVANYAILSEVNAQKELVWEALITTRDASYTEYRAIRLPLYRASDEALPIGSATVNLIPQDVLRAHGLAPEADAE